MIRIEIYRCVAPEPEEDSMRFQLALNVRDLDQAVAYYSELFGAEVNKRRPGYANFAIENPPLKLVLFENPEAGERLNHVGFEAFDNADVEATATALETRGVPHRVERDETCCYAKKSTVWATDPQGLAWEFYLYRGDAEAPPRSVPQAAPQAEAPAGCGCSA
jgi:catechol 2,3-dioxygenase-like lactoylglutathione lyase family enzyme